MRFVKTLLLTSARVLVGPSDAVDAEAALGVVMAERAPQPRGGDQQVEARTLLELLVPGREDVAADGVGHVGVDVEGGGAGWPVARALLAADRPPRERHARELEHAPRARRARSMRRVAPQQRVARGLGCGVRQHRERVGLHVPEGVPVIAAAGQPLGRDRPLLRPRAGLQDVEERETHGLLQRQVAVELDVRARSQKSSRYARCAATQPVPAGAPRRGERAPRPGRAATAASAGSTSRRPAA